MSERFEMQGSEAELSAMVTNLDEMHRAVMPTVRDHITELGESLRGTGQGSVSRRIFVMGGLGAAGAVTLAACGSKKSSGSSSTGSSPASGGSGTTYTGQTQVVALAAALENLAVAAYGYVLTEAGKGKYGAVPPAIGTFAETAKMQHMDHAQAWNAVLTGAGLKAVTTPAVSIAGAAVTELEGQKTLAGVATQALGLEEAAAATYLFAQENVTLAQGIAIAATIAPVEYQHAAILNYVLGKYPVPNAFVSTAGHLSPSMFTG